MPTITSHATDWQRYLDATERRDDLFILTAWAAQTLKRADIPCICENGSCLRCVTSRIVAQDDAREERARQTWGEEWPGSRAS